MATNNKYDRQLRLWGAGGQKALSETCIVLIRATAAGTETLKNLILPGIGSYCILDDVSLDQNTTNIVKESTTTENDVADVTTNTEYQSNFFLTKESITANTSTLRTRAQLACELLQELNPDVRGSWKHFDTMSSDNNSLLTFDYLSFFHNTILKNNSNNSNNSNNNNTDIDTTIQNIVVIGSDLEPDLLETISRICSSSLSNITIIPFIGVFSYGLLGIVKIQVPVPLPIMDTKTRDATPDLRLQYPMTGLLQLMDQMDNDTNNDWSSMTNIDHGHIPYPIILLRCMKMWKEQHNDTIPTTFHEKQEFQNTIKLLARNYDTELNFQEALKYAYLIYSSSSKVIDIQHIQTLQTTAKQYCNSSSELKKFYYMISAFIMFLHQHGGIPPLNGTIPDMVTSTDLYIKLQTIYKEQSTIELHEMKSYLNQVIQQENENNNENEADNIISDDELTTFCQNVYNLDLLSTGTFWDNEYANANDNNSSEHAKICTELAISMDDAADDVDNQNNDDDNNPYHHNQLPLLWYIGFRSCQLFYQQYNRYPGCVDNDGSTTNSINDEDYCKEDCIRLQSLIQTIVNKYKLQNHKLIQNSLLFNDTTTNQNDYGMELVRYGNAEIHTIASIVGGVASQEAIKIITQQYIPIQNTFIYNGIVSIGAVYKF